MMTSLDFAVTIGGIAYGTVLVGVMFFRNKFTEAARIDALIVPKTTDATRTLNLVIGLLLIGYNGYSLIH